MATYMSFPGQLPPSSGTVIVIDNGGGGGGGPATQLATPASPVTIATNSPTAGQVLIATAADNATWQNLPAAPAASINDLRLNGNTTNTATASGAESLAIGRSTTSSGAGGVTVGAECQNQAAAGTCVGFDTDITIANPVNANGAVAVGYANRISAINGSTAIGCVVLGHSCQMDTIATTRAADFNVMVGANCSMSAAGTANYRRNVIVGNNTRVASIIGSSGLVDDNVIIGTNNDILLQVDEQAAKNVILGTDNLIDNQVTTSVIIGVSNALPTASSTSDSVLIGRDHSIAQDANRCVLIGTEIASDGGAGVGIGANISRVGAQSIVIGSGGTTDGGATNVILGYNAAVVGNHSFCVTIGTGARALGGGSVAVGRNAAANTTDAIAIGNNAVCNALNAAQIGAGTNNTPESLKFRPYMIHDGTAGTTELLPLYKDAGGNYVTAQGPTPVPQMLFADSDPAFERTGTEWTSPNLSTGANNMFTVLTRDGVNFATGYQTGRLSVNGFDKRRGINQMWRYGSVRTTDNVSTFIPLQTVPFSHYCHMELTITAMRIATYHTAGNQFVTDVTGLDFTVDPGKIGGRTWAGIAACAIMGNGALWTARVDNNWNGNASDEDPAPITGSVLGILSGLSVAMFGLIPYVGPIMGALVDTAVQATVLAVTTDALYKTFSGKGFSRFDTGFNSFGDYEFDGLGCIEDTTRPLHRIVGVFVKGKTGHKIEWNVIARSTVVPFAHPRYPG